VSAKILKTWEEQLEHLRQVVSKFPDGRTGDNTSYLMEDFGLGAFSTFFTQSPSFLANQKNLQKAKGQSNAQSLFHLQEIPSDNQIRQMLDRVPPEKLFPCYDAAFESLRQTGHLESWRILQDTFLIALDGTWYHSSDKIHCPNCSCLEHKSGGKTYYHSAVTPVLVAPSTAHDSENQLVRAALAALAEEPVRVVATTNRVRPQVPIEVPANAVLVDWLSYSQLMPIAALVISHGGHGTVTRALGAGTPVLIAPITGDMGETAIRVSWAGVGRSLPWRLCRPGPLRWAARRVLADSSFAARARQIAVWGAKHDGADRGAELVEQLAR